MKLVSMNKNGANVLDRLDRGSRVALIRLRSLGDSVLATPAIRLLQDARPDLEIGVVSEPRFAAVYSGNPDISTVLEPKIRALRAFEPALCVNLHGGTRSARLTLFSGARLRAGFGHFRYPGIYNVRIPRAQEILGVDRTVHTAEHAASAMFFLGVRRQEIPRAQLFTSAEPPFRLNEPYAVIHPAASSPEKTWPAASFISTAEYLERELALQPVFIGGAKDDVAEFGRWPVVAGASLERVKALLAGASLFVGNDSGPAHMAAAFGVPAAVIFGPSNPAIWGPWKTECEVFVSQGPIHTISATEVARALDRIRVPA